MIPKHDRVKPRTVEDLERKYNFGKRNEEMRGLASKKEVEAVKNSIPDVSNFATGKDIEDVSAKIPTNTSQLTNDSNFATTGDVANVNNRFENYATKTYVANSIAEAQLNGDDSDIDLSGYATKDEVLVSLEQTQESSESGGTNIL